MAAMVAAPDSSQRRWRRAAFAGSYSPARTSASRRVVRWFFFPGRQLPRRSAGASAARNRSFVGALAKRRWHSSGILFLELRSVGVRVAAADAMWRAGAANVDSMARWRGNIRRWFQPAAWQLAALSAAKRILPAAQRCTFIQRPKAAIPMACSPILVLI